MIALAAMRTTSRLWRRLRRAERMFIADCRAMGAVEFAFIVPLMLVLFLGTVEFSSGLASSRKVTLTASALSNLASEMPASINIAPVADSDLQNMFTAGVSIMNPYLQSSTSSVTAQISEIYVDSSSNATYQWSRAATLAPGATQAAFVPAAHNPGDPVTDLPSALLVKQTYLIRSDVGYTFVPYLPTIGYVTALMAPTGVHLSDVAYSRPRQATCLVYNGIYPTPVNGACPLP
jgi:Flp pilus assembly protein TadG